MEEIRKMDLGELKDPRAELMNNDGPIEDKIDSISNRIPEESQYTKLTNKS